MPTRPVNRTGSDVPRPCTPFCSARGGAEGARKMEPPHPQRGDYPRADPEAGRVGGLTARGESGVMSPETAPTPTRSATLDAVHHTPSEATPSAATPPARAGASY